MTSRRIVVGTRASALAQWQAHYVVDRIKAIAPETEIEIKLIKTTGDQDQQHSLAELGGLGVFTKAIEDALLAREVDLAVHSLKDLPTEITNGLTIAAYPPREDPRDALVSKDGKSLRGLAFGARVGTSSARRSAQVKAVRPDVQIVPLRGNVDTRLAKARSDDYDAVVLAVAGIKRLNKDAQITEYLDFDDVLPDPGQGSLALQVRSGDKELLELVGALDDRATRLAVTAERSLLRTLGGGCRMPIGAFAEIKDNQLHISGMAGTVDGAQTIRGSLSGDPELADDLGAAVAVDLLGRGASALLDLTPLKGKSILITRAKDQAKDLAAKIQSLGGHAVEFPVLQFAPVADPRELDEALRGHNDWIVFTSANGVQAVRERLTELGLGTAPLKNAKLAAIGPSTAHSLADLGLQVEFVPTRFLGEQIAIELPVTVGSSVLLLRADLASDDLEKGLRARGVTVRDVDAYRTVKPPAPNIDISKVDAITFTSASTVRNFVDLAERQLPELAQTPIVCIGPVTAQAARELGLRVDAVAPIHTTDGMLAAMLDYFRFH